MSINANRLVSITPRVIGAGSADLETNGLLLTQNALIPAEQPALEFVTAAAVGNYFGAESPEADFANQYFSGINNQQKAVNRLFVARRISEDAAAWIKSAPITAKLSEIKAITEGSLTIVVNGTEKEVVNLDFSAANSFSDVATELASAVGAVSGAYNSDQNVIILTTTETGNSAAVSFATKATTGTDISELLGLTSGAGAVLSQGTDTLTAAQNMNLITTVSRNWVGFTTAYETDADEASALAAWADIDDDYVYFDWSTDSKMTNQSTQSTTKAAQLAENNYNCLAMVYGTAQEAAAFLAVGASIDWSAIQGIKTWFAKSASEIGRAHV